MKTKGSYGQPFTPAEVGQVQPGSAAEQGGVQPGDVILSIDGSTVQRFEDVQQIVRRNPGADDYCGETRPARADAPYHAAPEQADRPIW